MTNSLKSKMNLQLFAGEDPDEIDSLLAELGVERPDRDSNEVPPNQQEEEQEEQEQQEEPQVAPPDNEIEQLKQQNRRLTERLDAVTRMMGQNQQQQPPVQQEPEPDDEPEEQVEQFKLPPDFDDMSKPELVEWIVNEVNRENKELKTELKGIRDEVSQTRQETKLDKAKREIQETANKYPDFFQYQQDMMKLAERSPNLHPEELYALAKYKRRSSFQRTSSNLGGGKNKNKKSEQEGNNQPASSTEKPGANSGGTTEQTSYSRKEAIAEAMSRLDL